jgi:hypothetical protein
MVEKPFYQESLDTFLKLPACFSCSFTGIGKNFMRISIDRFYTTQ